MNFLSKITFDRSTYSDILLDLMHNRCDLSKRPQVRGTFKTLTLTDSLTGDSITSPETTVNVCQWSSKVDRSMIYLQHAFARILYGQRIRPGYPDVPLTFARITDEQVMCTDNPCYSTFFIRVLLNVLMFPKNYSSHNCCWYITATVLVCHNNIFFLFTDEERYLQQAGLEKECQ